jgi:energy-coupling factor transporter ATP-binding protein EcfA2
MNFTLLLPRRDGQVGQETVRSENNIVIVGANGSGKTRLGVWIEEQHQQHKIVHRISAQKALNIPESATLKNLQQALDDLLFGSPVQVQGIAWTKNNYRWGRNPANFLLNDFDQLLSLLFAKTNERDRLHTQQTKEQQTYIEVAESPIDTIVKIWSTLMPHRSISFVDGKVLVQKEGEANYHGKELSDGERVVLYLIGHCISAPDDSIIIIDEPEVHLHKSIVSKLWDKIEGLCPNKMLIYITHDLDFAASRMDAWKIWVKSHNGKGQWEWAEVPQDAALPEALLLEVLGNRKNIIFCEGERGSLDTAVYELFYPDFHIIPRGGGDKVIEATKAFRANDSLHHLQAFGIIDSDFKEQAEIDALLAHGIHTLGVAEIENLFCVAALIRIVARHQEMEPDAAVRHVTDFLVEALRQELDVQVSSKAEKLIQYKLNCFSKMDHSESGLQTALQRTYDSIDVHAIYSQCRELFEQEITNQNLDSLLLIYNRKSLPDRISHILGLTRGEYSKLLIRLYKGAMKSEISVALAQYLPSLVSSTEVTGRAAAPSS